MRVVTIIADSFCCIGVLPREIPIFSSEACADLSATGRIARNSDFTAVVLAGYEGRARHQSVPKHSGCTRWPRRDVLGFKTRRAVQSSKSGADDVGRHPSFAERLSRLPKGLRTRWVG